MSFYMNKYQKHVAFSYGRKLVCIDDKFSKPFKSYLGEDPVYNFINSMVAENKFYTDIKKYFNKELVMTKEDDEILKTLINVGFVIMLILRVMLK